MPLPLGITPDAPHATLSQASEAAPDGEERLMLRMFQLSAAIGAASCGLALAVAWPAGQLTDFEKLTIPVLFAAFVAMLATVVLTGGRHLVLLGHALFALSGAFLVLNLANALFLQAEPELATIYAFWMPVLYILGTAVLGAARSQRICWATFAVVVVIYAVWLVAGPADRGAALTLPMELVLAESLITQAAALGFLYVLAAFRERNAAAQARAAALAETAERLQGAIDDANAARAEAEAAGQARSLFVATMNHELRTPLNAILGFAELIRDKSFGENAVDTYAEYAGHIHHSGLNLRTLVEDILEFARIEANKMKLERAPCDLGAVIDDVATMMEASVRGGGVSLAVEKDASAAPVFADRRAIRLILVNLVSNALRETRAGGAIRIGLNAERDGWCRLWVADDGPGMSAEKQRAMFEPFAFKGSAFEAQEGGAGIGFYVVKALVDQHRGTIAVDTEPGEGTRVTIRLPGA